jgi:hypothetical protein
MFAWLRRLFRSEPADPEAYKEAERVHDRQAIVRASQTSGGTPFMGGSGASNPTPTGDITDPRDPEGR